MRPIPTEARQPHPPHPHLVPANTPDGSQPYQMVADQPTLITGQRGVAAPATTPRASRPLVRPAPQSSDWLHRCRELAWEHGLMGMAQPLGRGQFGDARWRVPSKSAPGTVHTVHCSVRDGGAYRCDCIAGSYSNPCSHVGAVLFHQDTQTSVLDPREVAPSETTPEYRAWFAWRLGQPVTAAAAAAAAATESDDLSHMSREERRAYGEMMAAHYDAEERAGR